ncbi:hypothetical protein Tco_0851160 [Tanacetum coccineum]
MTRIVAWCLGFMKWVSDDPSYVTGGEPKYPQELFSAVDLLSLQFLVSMVSFGRISPNRFLSSILLVVVIIVTVVIVVVILVVVIFAIVEVVIVVVEFPVRLLELAMAEYVLPGSVVEIVFRRVKRNASGDAGSNSLMTTMLQLRIFIEEKALSIIEVA